MKHAFLAALSLALSACAGPLAKGPSVDLRLRHVVLYQNGLGYFERTGVMSGERLTLRFREREVDDVLKSMVVVEQNLGPNETPSTVSALLPRSGQASGPEEPTELELVFSPAARRPVSIAYAVPTAAWKATYRVILPAKGQKEKRALLQAWALISNIGDEDWSEVDVTLATGAPLSYVSNLRAPAMLDRPELKGVYDGEGGALAPVLSERSPGPDTDRDGVLDHEDACPREPGSASPQPDRHGCPHTVRVASSSEIQILTAVPFDKGSDVIPPRARPLIEELSRTLKSVPHLRAFEVEGHASSDESGAADLAARRAAAVRAALLQLGVTAELVTRSHGTQMPLVAGDTEEARQRNRRVALRALDVGQAQAPSRGREAPAVTPEAMEKVPEGAASVDAVAGAFRYAIANPVTLPKKSSALITLINRPVAGADVLLFRPDPAAPASATHPFRAAQIENRSALGLQPGSVSIFSGGTFVGEGVLTRLLPGESATIPYAIDSSTEVRATSMTTDVPVRFVSLSRGALRVEDRYRRVTVYDVRPGRDVPETLLIRHARATGFEPQGLPGCTDAMPDACLVEKKLAPGAPQKVVVEETRLSQREIPLVQADSERLSLYLKGSSLPAELRARLDRALALRRALDAANDELDPLRRRRAELIDRAAELRESLRTIERTPQAGKLRQTMLDRLAEVARQSEEIGAKITQRIEDVAMARAELDDTLRDLVIEGR
ncbi:OmpA family protein [Sorangium atrum]|uniref:OmpA family protein n=1 Tax=Sorangium atrum TaxID=2995308 RepID=A0ABT5BXP4_9BACT|nr:OmpA family protein [Sorangium aterium]MDC0678930.1 OmpA family protein [Sorangium aterium]